MSPLAAILNSGPASADTIALLAGVLETLPVAVAVAEATDDLRFVYANHAQSLLVAPDRLPVAGSTWLEVFPEAARHGDLDAVREVIATGAPRRLRGFEHAGSLNAPVTLPGGATVWDWDGFPLLDAGGRVSHVLSVATDRTAQELTRRRLLEAHESALDTLSEVSRHLDESEALPTFFGRLTRRVAELIHARCVAFARLDEPRGALDLQPECHGVSEEQGRRIDGLPCRRGGGGLTERVVFGGETVRAGTADGDGERADTLLDALGARSAVAVPWRAGRRPLGVLVACDSLRDGGFGDEDLQVMCVAALAAGLVWQQKRTEESLAQATERESAALRAHAERSAGHERIMSEFLKLASHELRAPLAVLRGYLTMAEDGTLGEVPAALGRILPVLSARATAMSWMVDLMLETARLEDGRLHLACEPLDIRHVIAGVAREIQPLVDHAHRLELSQCDAPAVVLGDHHRLATVLSNLIDNALKYSPSGGVVRVDCAVDGQTVSVAVTDQGTGIAERDMPRLFTRFGRIVTRDNGHIAGTGLGLYLCEELVRLHGGTVSVRSRLGEGSTFTVTLPLAATPA